MTSADILLSATKLFTDSGLKAEDYFYYGEIILDFSIRNLGYARQVFFVQEQYANSLGFKNVVISTVVRNKDEGKANDTNSSQIEIWKALGFERTKILFEFEWPTIMSDGTTKPFRNTMVFWTKAI